MNSDALLAMKENAYLNVLDEIQAIFQRHAVKGEDAVKIMAVGIGQIMREQSKPADLANQVRAVSAIVFAQARHTPPAQPLPN